MAATRETITIVRKPKVDKLKSQSGATAEENTVSGCYVLPRASQEEGGGWIQVSGFTIVAPVGTDVLASDQLLVRDELHNVVGEPGQYPVRKGKPGLFITTERVAKAGT